MISFDLRFLILCSGPDLVPAVSKTDTGLVRMEQKVQQGLDGKRSWGFGKTEA